MKNFIQGGDVLTVSAAHLHACRIAERGNGHSRAAAKLIDVRAPDVHAAIEQCRDGALITTVEVSHVRQRRKHAIYQRADRNRRPARCCGVVTELSGAVIAPRAK